MMRTTIAMLLSIGLAGNSVAASAQAAAARPDSVRFPPGRVIQDGIAVTGRRAEVRAARIGGLRVAHSVGAGVGAAAVAAAAAIRLDGRLDEAAWRAVGTAGIASNLQQREPLDGAPATEQTEVRVIYDATTLYIGVTATDREPAGVIARILQRDRVMEQDMLGAARFAGDDGIAILLDPFDDHRNAFVFATNANGAEFDALVTDEGREFNKDWRGVWRVAAARTATGWSAEFAIPFSTLRYKDGQDVWGLNVSRMIRRKNEETLWQSWERAGGGFLRVSRAGHLTGLTDLPRAGRNVEMKPYTLGAFDHERVDESQLALYARDARSVTSGSGGVDVKAELRPGLVLDATLNTDFAQVEVDDQQVNLTRFNLFFPEKREFFLENAGIFQFGAPASFGPPPFQLFFSRRIGLAEDGPVPVLGGARVTGRVGRQTVGFLDIVTDTAFGDPRRNFGVMRVKRDVGESGYVGAMVTDRRNVRNSGNANVSNTAGGVDWSLWPTRGLNVQGFAARTGATGVGGDDAAYRVALDYQTGRFGFTGQHLGVGPEATAEAGFITRTDIRQSDTFTRLTFRPGRMGLRSLQIFYVGVYTTRMDGLRMDVNNGVALDHNFNSGESFTIFANAGRSRVDEEFDLSDSVTVAAKDYSNSNAGFFASTSAARPVSANVFAQQEWNYGGSVLHVNTNLNVSGGPHLSFGIGHTYGDVALPQGGFRFNLASARVGVAFTTRVFLNSLVQVNTLDRNVSTNVRLQYMYRPGSDIFLVFSEDRGNRDRPWRFEGRSVRLKVTWLARI